jgi:hypothetical protein
MSVIPIDSRKRFRFNGPRAHNKVLEGLKILADVVTTFWVTVLTYNFFGGHVLPFYLTVFTQTFGFALGVFLYKKHPITYLSCLPVNHIPDIPKIAYIHDMKKAA